MVRCIIGGGRWYNGMMYQRTACRFDEKCWTVEKEVCKTVYDTVWDNKCEMVNITVPQRECDTTQEMVMEMKCKVVNETINDPMCVTVMDKEVEEVGFQSQDQKHFK